MADVIVVGGGPAGSTAATMLARQGWGVVLYERERFPREHIGESLLPASIPILAELGAMPAIEAAGFLPKFGATMVWGTTREPWSWYFRETNPRIPSSFQVWRPQFDQILLDNTRASGVEVHEGSRVLEVLFDRDRAVGVRLQDEKGAERVERASFVVDASGQAGLVGRARGLRRPDEQFRNLAMYAYFTGAEKLPAPDSTNIFIESYEHGWAWVIPLHTGHTSVGYVVDSKVGQEAIGRLGLADAYESQRRAAVSSAQLLRSAMIAEGPFVIRDWSYVSDEVAGDGFVIAGDAACFIDPLFSTGVHLALSSGVLSAAYVTTALRQPDIAPAAGAEYKRLYFKQYSLFRELARLFYSSNRTVESYFWEARRIIDADESVPAREAFIRAAAGQPPAGYERVVLDRGEVPEPVTAGIREVQAERAWRTQEVRAVPDEVLLQRVPVLAEGTRVEHKPVLGNGEFVMGAVICGPRIADDVPASAAVAALASRIDGRAALGEIAASLADGATDVRAKLERVAVNASRILFTEGIIEAFRQAGES